MWKSYTKVHIDFNFHLSSVLYLILVKTPEVLNKVYGLWRQYCLLSVTLI